MDNSSWLIFNSQKVVTEYDRHIYSVFCKMDLHSIINTPYPVASLFVLRVFCSTTTKRSGSLQALTCKPQVQ